MVILVIIVGSVAKVIDAAGTVAVKVTVVICVANAEY